MTGDGMMARTTLVFLQVLDVFFQSFIHATWVKLTIRYMVWRNFSPFLMIKSWLVSFSLVTSVVWGIVHYPGRIGYFHLNERWLKEWSPWSLLLYCVVLATFDPLYFYIVTVCKDDLWSWGFVGTSRWNISIVNCNCKDWVEAQLVSSILCSWYTHIYIYIPLQAKKHRVIFRSSSEHTCLNSASPASTLISD